MFVWNSRLKTRVSTITTQLVVKSLAIDQKAQLLLLTGTDSLNIDLYHRSQDKTVKFQKLDALKV